MQIRGRCLAEIVGKIDNLLEQDGYLEIEEVYGLVDSITIPFWSQLSNNDYSCVRNYIREYLDILLNKKGITINGYTQNNAKRDSSRRYSGIRHIDPYDGGGD